MAGILKDERLLSIFAFLFLIGAGVPVWWKTTEVYRANLPHLEISSLQPDQWMNSWDIRTEIVLLQPSDSNLKQLEKLLHASIKKIESSTEKYNTYGFQSSIKLDSKIIVAPNLKDLTAISNEEFDEWIHSTLKPNSQSGRLHFYLVPSTTVSSLPSTAIFGKHRHGWITYSSLNQESDITELISKGLQSIKARCIPSEAGFYESSIAVRPAPEYHLSFSLLNADPSSFRPSWDFKRIHKRYFKPFLDQLRDLANFTIDSQVLQYASLSQAPLYDQSTNTYYLKASSLPHFINPFEWKLDFADNSTQPVLNFILYIPGKDMSPLRIKRDQGSYLETNSFVLPQWGGIVIYNPKDYNASIDLSDDILPSAQLFIMQLRELFGLGPINTDQIVPAKRTGIAQWEIDLLLRRYTFYNLKSTTATLQSLSKLVLNLTNMVVLDNIAELCTESLSAVNNAISRLEEGSYVEAFTFSRSAYVCAEKAFFDPNMLALLYFPDEHKYAIYALPFFPIAVQVLSGIWTEWKFRRQIKQKPKQD